MRKGFKKAVMNYDNVRKPLLSALVDNRTFQERGDDPMADLISGSMTGDRPLIFDDGMSL